jgi:hypothetical protein
MQRADFPFSILMTSCNDLTVVIPVPDMYEKVALNEVTP